MSRHFSHGIVSTLRERDDEQRDVRRDSADAREKIVRRVGRAHLLLR